MDDEHRTRDQLLDEVRELRRQVESHRQGGDATQDAAAASRFRALVEQINDALYEVDAAGTITYISPAIESITGYAPDEVVGRPFVEFVYPDDLHWVRDAFAATLGGEAGPDDWRAVTRDGSVRWVRTSSQAIVQDGRPVGIRGTLADIDDAKRAETALAESETRYRTLFDSLPTGVILQAADGRIVRANEVAAETLRMPRDSVEGRTSRDTIWEMVDEQGVPVSGEVHPSMVTLRTGRPLRNVVRGLYSGDPGRMTWLVISTEPLGDRGGGLPREVLVMFQDITERKQAEESLRRERDFIQRLIETAQVIILVLDPQGRIVSINPYMEEISGYRQEEVEGKDWFDTFIPEAERVRIRPLFLRAVGDLQTRGNANAIVTRDGSQRLIEWYDKTLKDAAGNVVGLLSTGQDITERRRAEEQLVRTQRLRAAGELAAGVSHNLNNILSGVMLPAQMLKLMSSDPEILAQAENIVRAGERARDLAHRLHLAVRGVAEDELQPVSLNRMIEQAVELTRPRWRDEPEARGLRVDVELDLGEVPEIRGTASRLHDVLVNLLLNAVDAMPRGGSVTIASRPAGADAELVFSDTGVGMDEQTLRRVFEPFFTTKQEVGTGLGLATVHNTVQQWGGAIEVESQPRKGTTFTIRFPAWRQAAPAGGDVPSEPPAGRAGRLLIVDDDETTRTVLARMLGDAHQVRACASGHDALAAFAPGAYDVALVDLGMRDLPGDRLAWQLREADPALATILITGWELPASDPRLVPFDFYIQKPLGDIQTIESLVRRAVALHDGRCAEAPGA